MRERMDEPTKEEEENIEEEMNNIFEKLIPWHKQIMMGGMVVLITLVVFLGYAYGGLKVCSELDGVLDSGFKCHPNYEPPVRQFDNVGQPFKIPTQEQIFNISPELRDE